MPFLAGLFGRRASLYSGINLRRDFAVRWLRIAISFTVTLMTLLCMLPAQAAGADIA